MSGVRAAMTANLRRTAAELRHRTGRGRGRRAVLGRLGKNTVTCAGKGDGGRGGTERCSTTGTAATFDESRPSRWHNTRLVSEETGDTRDRMCQAVPAVCIFLCPLEITVPGPRSPESVTSDQLRIYNTDEVQHCQHFQSMYFVP